MAPSRSSSFLLCLLLLTAPLSALAADEPLFDELVSKFKSKSLNIGMLLQVVGDFQTERTFGGTNGFNISNARLVIDGELDGGFGYLMKTSFTRSPVILDAKMYYRLSSLVTLDVGLFKAPFSREYLTGAGSIDFVNRSQVVSALVPGRQIGIQLSGRSESKTFAYWAGMFNGNGYGANDNDRFMSVARVSAFPNIATESHKNDKLEIGTNFTYSDDSNATLGGGFLSNFNDRRTIYGGDFRLTYGLFLFSGEVINTDFEFLGGVKRSASGFHATTGYMVTRKSQLLLRWDSIKASWRLIDSDLLILGYNLWPTKATELQVNGIFPTSSGQKAQLLINAQFAF